MWRSSLELPGRRHDLAQPLDRHAAGLRRGRRAGWLEIDPAVALGRRRAAAGRRPRAATASSRSAIAAAKRAAGREVARAPRQQGGAAAGAAEDLHELHRREHEREAGADARSSRASACDGVDPQAALARAGRARRAAPGRSRAPTTSWPAAARSSATRPVPRAEVQHGPPRCVGELAPERQVGVVGAALDVVPDHAALGHSDHRSREPALARAGRAARAGPCRWAARRARSPAALADRGVQRARRGRARPRAPRPMPAYLSRSAISSARVPEQVTRRTRPAQHLEVGVPDPGDVAAVGDPVVERDPEVERAVLERQRAQHLVRAGRVLDQQDRQLAAVDRDRLHAAEGAGEALERLADAWRAARPARARSPPPPRRCRRCRGRAAGGAARARPGACEASTRDPVMPVQPHARGRHLRLGALAAAVRAAVAAHVAQVDRPRTRRRARSCGSASSRPRAACRAAPASRPRRRSRSRRCARGPRSATSGSSAFSTKRGPAVELGHELGPAVGEQLELAVAVELVAEQVREEQQARASRPARQPAARPRRPRRVRAGRARARRRAARWPRPRPCSSRRGCARPAARRAPGAAAIIAAVVVLPLVADTSTEPALELARHAAPARPGESLSSSRPGCGRAAGAPERGGWRPARGGRATRASRNIRTAR